MPSASIGCSTMACQDHRTEQPCEKAAARVASYDDNYSNHDIGKKGTKPHYEAHFVGRRLVIYLHGPDGIFHNDVTNGPGKGLLIGLSRNPKSGGIARFAIKFGKNGQARIVVHLRGRLRSRCGSGERRGTRWLGRRSARGTLAGGGSCGQRRAGPGSATSAPGRP